MLPAAGAMRGTAGQKPQLPMCHLCGQQFGTASLQIHQKACAQKYERERGRPAPERSAGCGEDRVIKPGSTAREVEEFNEKQKEVEGVCDPIITSGTGPT